MLILRSIHKKLNEDQFPVFISFFKGWNISINCYYYIRDWVEVFHFTSNCAFRLLIGTINYFYWRIVWHEYDPHADAFIFRLLYAMLKWMLEFNEAEIFYHWSTWLLLYTNTICTRIGKTYHLVQNWCVILLYALAFFNQRFPFGLSKISPVQAIRSQYGYPCCFYNCFNWTFLEKLSFIYRIHREYVWCLNWFDSIFNFNSTIHECIWHFLANAFKLFAVSSVPITSIYSFF